MAEIKKISTELQLLDKFLDTSGDAGTSGQVLTSTGTGINWVSGGSLPGGPYLPLSAGSSYPLTGDLYLDDGSGATPSLYFKNGDDNFWRYLMESGGDFSIKEGTSTRLTFQAGGNVGIGATSPGAKLDVDGSIRLSTSGTVEGRSYPYTTNIGSGANATTTNIKAGSTDKSEISLIGGDVGDRIEFKTNSTERMRIDSSGNVGIGTTTVQNKLVVRGSGSAFNSTMQNSTASIISKELTDNAYHSILQLVAVRQSLTTGKDSQGYLGFSTIDDSNNQGQLDAGRIAIVNETGSSRNSATALTFWTNPGGTQTTAAVEKMRITSAGGISFGSTGTAYGSAGQVLTSAGNASPTWTTPTTGTVTGTGVTGILPYWTNGPGGVLGDSIVAQGSQRIQISSGGGTLLMGQWDGSNNRIESASRPLFITSYTSPIKLGISGNTTMTIESSNVGIGVTSPNAKLSLAGGSNINSQNSILYIDTNSYYASSADRYITSSTAARYFQLNGEHIWSNAASGTAGNAISFAERMRIDSSGNVGIGVTDPEKKLEVKSDTTYDGIMLDVLSAPEITFRDRGNSDTRIGTGRHQLDGFHIDTYSGNAFLIKGSNRFVGIGTTSPDGKLEIVQTSGDGTPALIVANDISGVSGYTFQSWRYVDGNTNFRLDLKQKTLSSVVKYAFDMVNNGTGFNDVLVLDRGKVGIGTSSPISKFTVTGTDNTNQANIGHSTQSVFIKVNGTNVDYNSSGSSSGSHTFSTGNVERMRINSGGTVLINASAPRQSASKLSVQGGMSEFETTLTNGSDWANSPISILERANIGTGSSDNKYSPNLNFHWSSRVSNSLWMSDNGHLSWGSYTSGGVPAADGVFRTQEIYLIGTGRITGVDTVSAGTDAANKTYVDTAVAGAGSGTFLPLAGGTMDSSALIGGSGTLELGGSGVTNLLLDSDGVNIMQFKKASASLQYAQIISDEDKVRLRFKNGMDIYYDDTAIIDYMKFHALSLTTTQFKNDNFEIIGIGANNDEMLFKAEGGGAVSLYHNNVLQLNTTSTGISTNTIDATVAAGSAGNFVVMDGTRLAYRTAAQVLSDIGAASSGSAMTGFGVSNLVSGTGSTFTITNGQTVGILGGTNITSSVNTTNETITLSTLNPASGNWFRGVPQIGSDGLMEVGRYIDFHNTDTATSDFDVRLDCYSANNLRLTGSLNVTQKIVVNSQLGVGITPAAGISLEVDGKIRADDSNSGDYVQMYCDGSVSGDSFIENTNSSIVIKSANATTRIDASGAAANLEVLNASNVATIRLRGAADSFIAGGDLGIGNTGPVSGIKLDVTGKVLIKTSDGVSDLYMGNYSVNKYVRFHTNNSNTYFDMGCGLVYWRNPNSIKMTFDVANGNMTIDGTLTQNSDIKVKENIVEIDNCIGKVQAMRGVYYNRNDVDKEITKVGVIAQEVEAVLPELILEHPKDGLKSVAYSELTAVLINAIKEQQEIIEDLKTRITKLEN